MASPSQSMLSTSVRSPLLQCAPGQAVVASVSQISKKAHVRPSELREALSKMTHEAENVEVSRDDDGVTIGDMGFDTSPAGHKARLLHGARVDTHPTEGSHLLAPSSVRSCTVSTVQFTPCLLMTPISVRIKAERTPVDALFMLPSTLDDSCIVVLDGEDENERSWMSLPPAIKEIKQIGIKDHGFYFVVIEYARPAIVWFILLAAVIGLSSKAVVASAMYPPAVSPIVKSVWMTQVSAAGFVVLGLWDYCVTPDVTCLLRDLRAPKGSNLLSCYILGTADPSPHESPRYVIPGFSVLMVTLASVLHGLFSIFFLVSLEYTTLEQCVVLMNVHPVLVLCSRLDRSNTMERVGAVVVCVGVVALCFSTPSAAVASNPLLGDMLAFAVSVFMWFYLSLCQKLQEELPSGMLMACINLGSLAVQSVFLFLFDTTPLGFSIDAFMQYAVPNLLGGLFGGFLAYGGFIVASRYLNPLIVSVHITLEPLFAVMIQVLTVGPMPALQIWASLMTLVAGTVAVAVGGRADPVEITDFDMNLLST